MLHTVSEGLQNGGDVDRGLVVGVQFSPALPVLETLRHHVIVRDATEQHHHSVRRVKESMKRSVQFRVIEHVQEGSGEQQHDALAAVEVFKVISMELIRRADRVQQDRPFAELSRGF